MQRTTHCCFTVWKFLRCCRYFTIYSLALLILLPTCKGSSGQFVIVKSSGGQSIDAIAFSSDGENIAYAEKPKQLLFGGEVASQFGDKPEGETWLTVKPMQGEPKRLLKLSDGSSSAQVAWRPRRRQITFSSKNYEDLSGNTKRIYLMPASGGEPEKLADGNEFAWSPDGRYLAYTKPYSYYDDTVGMYLLDYRKGSDRRIAQVESKNLRWAAGKNILVFEGKWHYGNLGSAAYKKAEAENGPQPKRYFGDIYIFDVVGGRVKQLTRDGNHQRPAISSDGSRVAAMTYTEFYRLTEKIVVIQADDSQEHDLIESGGVHERYLDFCFAPDGKSFIFRKTLENTTPTDGRSRDDFLAGTQSNAYDLFEYDFKSGEAKRLKDKKLPFKENPRFSPDGKFFSFSVTYADWNREFWAKKLNTE